jgi:hypothetical protein
VLLFFTSANCKRSRTTETDEKWRQSREMLETSASTTREQQEAAKTQLKTPKMLARAQYPATIRAPSEPIQAYPDDYPTIRILSG